MAGIYLRCGYGVNSFVIHSYSSGDYPKTITTTSLNGSYNSGFATGSTDAYIDTVSTSVSGSVVVRSWSSYEDYKASHTGYSSSWYLANDKYISTSSTNRYIEVAVEASWYGLTLTCGTGVDSFKGIKNSTTGTASSYYTFSQTFNSSSGYFYLTDITLESGYTYPIGAYDSNGNLLFTVKTSASSWSDHYVSCSSTSGVYRGVNLRATVIPTYTYKLLYNANRGSGAPATQTYGPTTYNMHVFTIPDTIPTKSGYTFLGWGITSSAITPSYQPGDTYTMDYTNTSAILYAVWAEKKTYTWTFGGNGGTFPQTGTGTWTYTYETSDGSASLRLLASMSPTRSDYTFLGYSTTGASPATFKVGDTITLQSSSPTISLKAVWQETNATLTLDANGGRFGLLSTKKEITEPVGTVISFADYQPTRNHYILRGWATTSTATEPQYGKTINYQINYTRTLYAVWEKEGYIAPFYWISASDDPTYFMTQKKVEYALTATNWNKLKAKVAEATRLIDGGVYSYTNVSKGSNFLASEFNDVRSAIANLTGSGSITGAKSAGNTVYASYFEGTTSLKQSLNTAINAYNND